MYPHNLFQLLHWQGESNLTAYTRYRPQTSLTSNLSNDLRMISVRSDDQGGTVDWKNMAEIVVKNTDTYKIFFKTNHMQEELNSLSMKQRIPQTAKEDPTKLYFQPPTIAKDKT
ncbi:hypothetical protein E2C01_022445 [Portunus trituberculatus]|uniref:Uncharacterized protein n=1 Tax=Portunus trituberculatus TaxID=210409 RepID=A0A5B7E8X9_PORTR|nr:hypothetical protein [Portunus trituberculatus]